MQEQIIHNALSRPGKSQPLSCSGRTRIAALRLAGASTLAGFGGLLAVPVAAQAVSQPVVQALPSPAIADLQAALRRLARDTRDLDALIDAGTASLQLNDIDAAIGFFGRAEDLSPGNPRIKVGLAGAFLRSDRPLEALRLFSEAETAGASTAALAGDRGLAYDLVGDNASAQAQYRRALSSGGDAEMQRRLALSQAISGDREGFEQTLLPMLNSRDFGAYRVRAFGLAILGHEEEAVAIAEAVMPGPLSDRIVPYLRYMPRLTRAQQAAAGNLGIFPRAAQIGRDDPRIAQYSANAAASPPMAVQTFPQAVASGSRLTPSGPPLGGSAGQATASAGSSSAASPRQPRKTRSVNLRNSRRSGEPSLAEQVPQNDPETRRRARIAARMARSDRRSASGAARPGRAAAQAQRALPAQAQAEIQAQVPAAPLSGIRLDAPQPAGAAAQVAGGELPALPADGNAAPARLAEVAAPQARIVRRVITLADPAPDGPAPDDSAGNSLTADRSPAAAMSAAAAPVIVARQEPPAATTGGVPVTQTLPEPASLEEAFAAFSLAPDAAPVGGVDITSITPPREVRQAEVRAAPPVAETPPPPAHPSRIWVQVATGRDREALAFDWRRISRKAGDLLAGRKGYLAEWNEANRLLAGPMESRSAAQELVTALKAEEIDSFVFTSRAGEAVEPLG